MSFSFGGTPSGPGGAFTREGMKTEGHCTGIEELCREVPEVRYSSTSHPFRAAVGLP